MKKRYFLEKSRRQGATTVEMASVLPVLLLLVFGFFEAGHALLMNSIVENAAYEGARYGIVPGATEEGARNAAEDIALKSILRSVDVGVTINEVSPGVRGITVEVKAPVRENAFLVGPLLGEMTISRSVTMILESDLRFRFSPKVHSVAPPLPRPRGRGKTQ